MKVKSKKTGRAGKLDGFPFETSKVWVEWDHGHACAMDLKNLEIEGDERCKKPSVELPKQASSTTPADAASAATDRLSKLDGGIF